MSSTQTFLDACNAALKRAGVIQGSTGAITSFTSSAHQREVDTTIQVFNEAMQEVLGLGMFSGEVASATVVGVLNTREYDLPSDFVRVAGERPELRIMRSATGSRYIYEYPGGYSQMYVDQLTATDFTGTPGAWTINPVTQKIRFDTENDDSQTATATWNFLYEKQVRFTSTSTATGDVFPFGDVVVDALVPVVAETLNRIIKKDPYDPVQFKKNLANAILTASQSKSRKRWGLRYG